MITVNLKLLITNTTILVAQEKLTKKLSKSQLLIHLQTHQASHQLDQRNLKERILDLRLLRRKKKRMISYPSILNKSVQLVTSYIILTLESGNLYQLGNFLK
jgi:hypothetical protein